MNKRFASRRSRHFTFDRDTRDLAHGGERPPARLPASSTPADGGHLPDPSAATPDDIRPPELDERLATLTIELHCEDAPLLGVVVRAVELDEQLDGDYRADVLATATQPFAVAKLLGADCRLIFVREIERRSVHGVIEVVEDLGELDHRWWFRIELVPAFALLDHGCHSRIWQHRSVLDIVTAVLQPALASHGRSFDPGATTRGTGERDYCVQYRESDHAFVRRLLEEEGIAYEYVHPFGAGTEILTLRDAMVQYVELEEPGIPLIDHDAGEANVESVQSLTHVHALTATAARFRDYDWRAPRELLTELRSGTDERGRERLIYQHQHRRYIEDDLDTRTGDLLAAERVAAQTLRGSGNVTSFVPGARFTIYNAGELDGEYVLLTVDHHYGDPCDGLSTYTNDFTCIPAAVEYRPRARTPKPSVRGPHTATVVGDEEIHTDEHGRIQVQFHWEPTPSFATGASCWVRCAQSWAGPGWGAQFIPRVGMEVVVEFLEGNPDRPLVVGCVYNGANEAPFPVPEHASQSGWRTRSTPDSHGYNMVRFEDAAGREEIHIHGQRDLTIVVGHDEDCRVRRDVRQQVGRDRRVDVGRALDETIGQSMTLDVGDDLTASVGASMRVSVSQKASLRSGSICEITAASQLRLSCGAASLTLKASGEVEINGSKLLAQAAGDLVLNGGKIKLNPPAGGGGGGDRRCPPRPDEDDELENDHAQTSRGPAPEHRPSVHATTPPSARQTSAGPPPHRKVRKRGKPTLRRSCTTPESPSRNRKRQERNLINTATSKIMSKVAKMLDRRRNKMIDDLPGPKAHPSRMTSPLQPTTSSNRSRLEKYPLLKLADQALDRRLAATIEDIQTCPMCEPTKHVGGQIRAPGSATVEFEGRPAARASFHASEVPPVLEIEDEGARRMLLDNYEHWKRAGDAWNLDLRILASISYVEYMRDGPIGKRIENIGSRQANRGHTTRLGHEWSLGIAHFKPSTAEALEKAGYITPAKDELDRVRRLEDPAIAAQYQAAYIVYIQDYFVDEYPPILEQPDIAVTFYFKGVDDGISDDPTPSDNGVAVMSNVWAIGRLFGMPFGDGDYADCVGAEDNQLIEGSDSVLIDGLPLARLGDRCLHGGTIIDVQGTIETG